MISRRIYLLIGNRTPACTKLLPVNIKSHIYTMKSSVYSMQHSPGSRCPTCWQAGSGTFLRNTLTYIEKSPIRYSESQGDYWKTSCDNSKSQGNLSKSAAYPSGSLTQSLKSEGNPLRSSTRCLKSEGNHPDAEVNHSRYLVRSSQAPNDMQRISTRNSDISTCLQSSYTFSPDF